MNESLLRALLRARLSEEDVATHLQVDPKTVRRWLEGRVPYPRHRMLLAGLLGLDDADLWPHLSRPRAWPEEIQAVYPRREYIPPETWARLFGDAQEQIDILADSALFLTVDPQVLAILADRAGGGVKERICFRDPALVDVGLQGSLGTSARQMRDALARVGSLHQYGDVQVRVHDKHTNNAIFRSDGESLVSPGIYGIPATRIPAIWLCETGSDGLFEPYTKSFEEIWLTAYANWQVYTTDSSQ